jgi:hypothetical protein
MPWNPRDTIEPASGIRASGLAGRRQPAPQLTDALKQIRELQRVLGKETMDHCTHVECFSFILKQEARETPCPRRVLRISAPSNLFGKSEYSYYAINE